VLQLLRNTIKAIKSFLRTKKASGFYKYFSTSQTFFDKKTC